MDKNENIPNYNLNKYTAFFNYAKKYYWLTGEKNLGNLDRAIIREYHLFFRETMNNLGLEEFEAVWIALSEISIEIISRKKKEVRKNQRIENVSDL